MEMERLVVIWCPELQEEGPRGEEARRFVQVVAKGKELCPWTHPVRLGVCALPARGPSRFFGGEDMVVRRLVEAVGEDAHVGVADGLFAAVLAARNRLIVPAGGTPEFLAPWSTAVLGRPELAVTLQRLGITTLGQFADLSAPHVSDRFGADAALCHKVARGESGELPGLRDSSMARRLRVAAGEDPAATYDQPGFFGGTSEADRRAAHAFVVVQARLGVDAVQIARLQGGRDPAARAVLVPWGSPEDAGAPANRGAPWPGQIPPPSPTRVLAQPRRAEIVDAAGTPCRVTGRGVLVGEPARLSVEGGPWEQVAAWTGPWPVTERWWSSRRRHRARFQLVTEDGTARLLCTERSQWWVEALYD
ncbi:MAG TPA: hypothetical protein VL961_01860 [Acidimicrobiales bacterium]|nr:hypothetical protein [Acidimicrobiales bacterium]